MVGRTAVLRELDLLECEAVAGGYDDWGYSQNSGNGRGSTVDLWDMNFYTSAGPDPSDRGVHPYTGPTASPSYDLWMADSPASNGTATTSNGLTGYTYMEGENRVTQYYDSSGHYVSTSMEAVGQNPFAAPYYVTLGGGMYGVVGGVTYVWGHDLFLYGGVGTPGLTIEGGHTANVDMSGFSTSIGVPIGPGQVTIDPITGNQIGYAYGFGTAGASAQYSVNASQAANNGAQAFTSAWVNNYFPGYVNAIASAQQ